MKIMSTWFPLFPPQCFFSPSFKDYSLICFFSLLPFLPPTCYRNLQTVVSSHHLFHTIAVFFFPPHSFLSKHWMTSTLLCLNSLLPCVQWLFDPLQSTLFIHLIIITISAFSFNSQRSSILFWTPGSSLRAHSSSLSWHSLLLVVQTSNLLKSNTHPTLLPDLSSHLFPYFLIQFTFQCSLIRMALLNTHILNIIIWQTFNISNT